MTDSQGQSYQETIAIDVTDVNEAPTDITLSGADLRGSIELNTDGGNDAYLFTTDGGSIVGGLGAMTLEVGFSSTHAVGTDMPLFSYHTGGASDEIELGLNDFGTGVQLYIEIGEQATGVSGFDATQLLDGADHQVSLTWDNAAGDWEIFVDGSSVASGSGIAAGQTIAPGGTIVLGQEQDSLGGGFDSAQVFDGVYNDVRIFNDVRTPTEISDNAFTQLDASEPGLVANWQMNDLDGGVTTEIVSGNDLSVGHATGAGWSTSTVSLTEDTTVSIGTTVGTAAGIDPDAGDTLTYALTDDAGGLFSIDANTGDISIAQGTAATPEFTQQTSFADNPFAGDDAGSYSNPALVDIDGDGDLDAFVGESNGNVRYYENTGDSANPNFAAPVNNPFGLADVGSFSAPTFADIDGDGDLDAFVGDSGGNIDFFENTGTSTSASFSFTSTNPYGLTDVGSYATPEFADIDGDGDLDAFVADSDGNIDYFENTGTNTSASFATAQANPFGLSDVGSFADITLGDIDGDGDIDALVGDSTGNLAYFENTGDSANPSFAASTANPFGLVDVGSDVTPVLADLDGDGDLDLTVGESDGTINYFENTTVTSTVVDLTGLGSQSVDVEVTDAGGLTYTETVGIQFGTDGVTGSSGTITTANYTDTSSGYTVTASNVSGGVLTAASVSNITTTGGGLAADGAVSDTDSGATNQIAYDLASGLSEELIITFDNDIDTADFSFANLFSQNFGEVGHWAVYNDGALVSESDFTEVTAGSGGGTITIDPTGVFDSIVFTGNIQNDLSDGSDFVVTSVDYTEVPTGDTLTGTGGDDIMYGFGGGDTIDGGDRQRCALWRLGRRRSYRRSRRRCPLRRPGRRHPHRRRRQRAVPVPRRRRQRYGRWRRGCRMDRHAADHGRARRRQYRRLRCRLDRDHQFRFDRQCGHRQHHPGAGHGRLRHAAGRQPVHLYRP